MDYNWGDPKKNSLLSSRMMAKAELTRKQRLTCVKSALSNQLHPAIEHKLRKTKRANDSARRHRTSEGGGTKSTSSCNNNESQDCPAHSEAPQKTVPQVVSEDEGSNLDTIRHDAFPVPTHSSYANVSMFDKFGLNAAADGLFHPASTIEAFTEHDAKYHQEIQDTSEKPRSEPRRVCSGSEYPPSRENHRLPALHSGKAKCGRRPASKLQPAGKNGSAPASMTTTSSLSTLVDAEERKDGKRSLSATQSDSNLFASRRLDIVPSLTDVNALDIYEHELGVDSHDNNSRHSPRTRTSRAVSELDNNEIPDVSISGVPPLDFSLATKFEELKKIMKSNRERHNSDRQSNNGKALDEPRASTRPRSSQGSARSAIRTSSSGSSGSKTGGEPLKGKSTLKRRSVQAPRATANMNSGSSGSKHAVVHRVARTVSRTNTSNGGGVIVPVTRSKREAKERSGVSLSDLKAEHREALQMLKELGGPVDPDYLQTEVDSNAPKRLGAGRFSTRGRVSEIIESAGTLAHKKSPNQLPARTPTSTPPTSANSSVSMVTKLRESITSGRSSPVSPLIINSAGDTAIKSEATSTVSAPTEDCDNSLPPTNRRPAEVSTGRTSAAQQIDAHHTAKKSCASPQASTPISDTTDPWKLYNDDTVDEEDEDNNGLERDGNTEQKGSLASGDRYSDEDFESDR